MKRNESHVYLYKEGLEENIWLMFVWQYVYVCKSAFVKSKCCVCVCVVSVRPGASADKAVCECGGV